MSPMRTIFLSQDLHNKIMNSYQFWSNDADLTAFNLFKIAIFISAKQKCHNSLANPHSTSALNLPPLKLNKRWGIFLLFNH